MIYADNSIREPQVPLRMKKTDSATQKLDTPLFNFEKVLSVKNDFFPLKTINVPVASIKNVNFVQDYTKGKSHIDGDAGDSKQVKDDCWLLSGVNAVANTTEGRKAIKKSVRKNPETKQITVYLKGVNREIVTSPEAFTAAKQSKNYVKGDDDVLAIELAVESYKADLLKNGDAKNNNGPNVIDGKTVKGDKETPLAGGFASDLMFLLTGKKAKTTFNVGKVSLGLMKNSLDNMKKHPQQFAVTCNFKKATNGIVINHAYAVKGIDDNRVILINPWDSSKEESVQIEQFFENVKSLSVLDMK